MERDSRRKLEKTRPKAFQSGYFFWHFGEGFQTVLITWYMTMHAGFTAGEIGLFQALSLVPFLIAIWIGGAVADRFGGEKSFHASTATYGLLLIGFAALELLGFTNHFVFGCYCVIAGCLSAISNPAIDSLIADSSDNSISRNVSIATFLHNGAKLGGTMSASVLQIVGASLGFVLNSLAFVISAGLIRVFKIERTTGGSFVGSETDLRNEDSVQGENTGLPKGSKPVLFLTAVVGLFEISAGYVLVPLKIADLEGSAVTLSGFFSMFWLISTLSNGWLLGRIDRVLMIGTAITMLRIASSAFLFLFFYTTNTLQVLVLAAIYGWVVGLASPLTLSIYLARSTKEMRGRMMSAFLFALWGTATVGAYLLGIVVENFGLHVGFIVSSICVFLGSLAFYVWHSVITTYFVK